MAKQLWKPGNMLYPLPAVLVTCRGTDGTENVLIVAWTGTVCSDPAMTCISVRPERYSYGLIRESGEFVINLTTKRLVRAADFCGVRSGRDLDKFAAAGLTRVPASVVAAPLIAESPVNIECVVTEHRPLGSHDLFLAKVAAVHADEAYLDGSGRFSLAAAEPIAYSHGAYYALGECLGTFGFSVKRNRNGR